MMLGKKIKRALVLGSAVAMLTSTTAFAAPGYIIGGKRYVSSELTAHPEMVSQINQAIATNGLDKLIVDLDTYGIANYYNFKLSYPNGGVAEFKTYSAANPASVPKGTVILHYDGTTEADPSASGSTDTPTDNPGTPVDPAAAAAFKAAFGIDAADVNKVCYYSESGEGDTRLNAFNNFYTTKIKTLGKPELIHSSGIISDAVFASGNLVVIDANKSYDSFPASLKTQLNKDTYFALSNSSAPLVFKVNGANVIVYQGGSKINSIFKNVDWDKFDNVYLYGSQIFTDGLSASCPVPGRILAATSYVTYNNGSTTVPNVSIWGGKNLVFIQEAYTPYGYLVSDIRNQISQNDYESIHSGQYYVKPLNSSCTVVILP